MNRQQFLLLVLVACIFGFVLSSSDDNTLQYQEALQFGRGQINHVAWNPNGDTILAVGYTQVWLYDTNLDLIADYDLRTEINTMLWNIDGVEQRGERTGRVADVIWSPDGDWFAVKISPDDATPRWQLWRYENDEFTRLLPNSIIDHIQWSPNGAFFSIIHPNEITIHNTQFHNIISTFDGDLVSWSDDSQYLAVAHEQSVNIYATNDFLLQSTFQTGESGIKQFEWSNDSTRLAGVSAGNSYTISDEEASRIYVWDIQQETTITFQSELIPNYSQISGSDPLYIRPPISDVLWSSDDTRLLIAEDNTLPYQSRLSIFETTNGEQISSEIHSTRYISMEWISDNNYLIWVGVGGSGYRYIETLFAPEDIYFNDSRWSRSPDASLLATGNSRDNLLRIYDADTLELLNEYGGQNGRISNMVWSPDNQHVLTVYSDKEMQIWDIETGQITATNDWHSAGWILDIVGWNSTGDYFMTVSSGFGTQHTYNSDSVRIWDTETLEPINAFTEYVEYSLVHEHWVNETTIAITNNENTRLINALTGEVLETMPLQEIDRNLPNINADSTFLVEYIPDINGLRFTDLQADTVIHEVVVDDAFVLPYPVVWHPSEAILFFTVDDYENDYYTLQAVDLRGDMPEYHIIFASDWLSRVESLVWHPNGNQFATAHRDGTIRLWQEIR